MDWGFGMAWYGLEPWPALGPAPAAAGAGGVTCITGGGRPRRQRAWAERCRQASGVWPMWRRKKRLK